MEVEAVFTLEGDLCYNTTHANANCKRFQQLRIVLLASSDNLHTYKHKKVGRYIVGYQLSPKTMNLRLVLELMYSLITH